MHAVDRRRRMAPAERGGLGSFTPTFSGAAPDARAIGANDGEDDVVPDASAGSAESRSFRAVKNSITADSLKDRALTRSITTSAPTSALREAFTRNRVDTCIGRRRGTSGRWRSNATVFDPMRPVPPITTIRMLLLLPSLGSEDEKTATVT